MAVKGERQHGEQPEQPPDGGTKLTEWRLSQLENWKLRHDTEVERRRAEIDLAVEKLRGNNATTSHRLDLLVVKVTIWGAVIAAVVGFVTEHFLPKLMK